MGRTKKNQEFSNARHDPILEIYQEPQKLYKILKGLREWERKSENLQKIDCNVKYSSMRWKVLRFEEK